MADFKFQISNFKCIAGVYTFGGPRVGNAAFRDYYDGLLKSRTFRVVDGVDLVPHVPWLCGLYSHCGHEAYYDGCEGAQPYIIDRPLWQYALEDVMAMLSEWVRPTAAEQWIADHAVSKYQRLFEGSRRDAESAEPGNSSSASSTPLRETDS